jgi:hypothetical protein
MQDLLVTPHADWVDHVDLSHMATHFVIATENKINKRTIHRQIVSYDQHISLSFPLTYVMSLYKVLFLAVYPVCVLYDHIHHYICHSDISLHLYQFNFTGLLLA